MDELNPSTQSEEQKCKGAGTTGALTAMVIIGIGVVLLLDNFGLFRFSNIWKLWPLWLIAIGLGKAIDCPTPTGRSMGIFFSICGFMFLIGNFGWARVNWGLFWGLALIGGGLVALMRPGQWGRNLFDRAGGGFRTESQAGSDWSSSMNRSSDWAVFGASKRRMEATEYQGGEALALFGGVDIDLRDAHMKEDAVVLDATAIFGGIEIRVPEEWGVSVRGSGIFGGYEDKTSRRRPDGQKPEHYLIVNGIALFGGVEVKF